MLYPIFIYLASLVLTGALSAAFYRNHRFSKYFAAVSNAILSLIMLVFLINRFDSFHDEVFKTIWSLPMAEFHVGVDFLSLFFMIPLLILAAACSIYGSEYFKEHRSGRFHWFFYGLLVAGMMMVLISRNVVLFMISWEIMSFSSFLLVISEAQKESVRRAGWIYFVTAHVGTAFLLTAFFLLGSGAGSFNFELFGLVPFEVAKSNLIFIFALAGFGFKAGFIPFHVWLPLAHPAAPSHVSGLMSGIMIKMGIYGILRVLMFFTSYQTWWGILLVIIGASSGIIGILFAVGQHDIKRLLAYCSVENIGIILIGLGLGVLGRAWDYPLVSMFGFTGALLHIVNHALFKGLLFLGAGSVIRQTGTGEIDSLGGLFKKMPMTGSLFLAGSIAVSGLPFFNGFISELFIYAGAITGAVASAGSIMPMVCALAVMALALTGGLAAAGFTKLFGIVFQGNSRKTDISSAVDVPSMMKLGMIFLSVFLVFIGMMSFLVIPFIEKPMLLLSGEAASPFIYQLSDIGEKVSILLVALLILMIIIFTVGKIFRRKTVTDVETWGCGYTKPASSMQYTSSSYAEPITSQFGLVLAARKELQSDNEIFPVKPWSFRSSVEDWFLSRVFIWFVKLIDRILSLLRWFQCGRAGVYVLYIGCIIIILFIWKFVL
ncbi:MAG: hypothetical protein JEZ04_20585 [Spirochaetales bacterium]|nr:hypothetical protein [Spirochaetales bacterium]